MKTYFFEMRKKVTLLKNKLQNLIVLRGDVKKSVSFGGGARLGGGGLWCPTTTFGQKTITFLLPFDAEAFKICKNTIKLINLCGLPSLGLDLWLTLKVYFDLA